MKLRTLRKNLSLEGKRVLFRMDANVPIKGGKTQDSTHGKIARAAVDVQWLSQRGARVIVIVHVGRPGGKRISAYSTRAAAKRLSQLLGFEVRVARDIIGPSAQKLVEKMQDGDVVMLENLRFDPREEANDAAFAKELAHLGDLYVNDAFSVSHDMHASIDAITKELPSYAGPLLVSEVDHLSRLLKSPKHPFVLAMGGLKFKKKTEVMKRLLPLVETVMVGGALSTAFLVAKGLEVGKSVYDEEGVAFARSLLEHWGEKIQLPFDVVVASSLRNNAKSRTVRVDEITSKDVIVDMGRRTALHYVETVRDAKTIVWNGPFGYCERAAFCKGTEILARGIAARTGKALTIVGGGDTVPYVERKGLYDKFSLVSTGGGAMLSFLAGDALPGLESLRYE